MEFYAPAKGAPSSFATGLEASPASDIAGGGSSLAFYDDWRAQSKHAGGAQRSPGGGGSNIGVVDAVGASPSSEEAGWAMTMQGQEGVDGGEGSYPERAGEPDCVYYMRTGLCGFGATCRFNHPANRKLGAVVGRGKGEYPERVGQPECQYYLKTGTCKFGATCKYHHPREKAGSTGRVHLNVLGLPLRLGEKECAYYMRTGSCKYGVTCKFHHPQPTTVGGMVSVPFGSGGGPSSPAPQGYAAGALPSWPLGRSPFPLPRLQTHSSYGPMLPLQQGIMSMPGWSYQGPVGAADGHQQGYVFGGTPQGEHVSGYGPYMQGSSAVGLPAHQATQSVGAQKESLFPERPGQPECQYYMKTGDCKFGTTCRYHHPKDRATPSSTCHLSAMGLPLRPGNPPCSFYTRYGICKFGPTCKFDHPLVGSLTYSPSAGSLADVPVAPYPIGSSPMNLAPSTYSEGHLERQGSGEASGCAEDGSVQHLTSLSSSEGGGVSSGSGVNGGVGGAGSGSDPIQAESVGMS